MTSEPESSKCQPAAARGRLLGGVTMACLLGRVES
jgi:hypothetical protein